MSVPFWVEPRIIDDMNECYFYHTMDIPGHGLVKGNWDLRGKESEYLGHVDFQGKRVLEIGTASGHLCFSMEKMGAEVVAYDLSPKQDWDFVPLLRIGFARLQVRQKNANSETEQWLLVCAQGF